MASISRSSTPRGTRGSQMQTQTQGQASTTPVVTNTEPPQAQAILHLRGATRECEEVDEMGEETGTRRRIQWAENVVDNEGLGRKTSKVCCIYHAPKGIDESSDESSSSSDDSDSDSGDDGSARPARPARREGHDHGHDDHDHGKGKGKGRGRSPNAYEKIPKKKNGGTKER